MTQKYFPQSRWLFLAVIAIVASLALVFTHTTSAQGPANGGSADAIEAELEADKATNPPAANSVNAQIFDSGQGILPLFGGVDDATLTTSGYLADPATGIWDPYLGGVEFWAAAYDIPANILYISQGSTFSKYEAGVVSTIGTFEESGGTTRSIVSMDIFGDALYGGTNTTSGSGEGLFLIDQATGALSDFIAYDDPATTDIGGIAFDSDGAPADFYNGGATLYGVNDSSSRRGIVTIAPDGTITVVAPYPDGESDIDGLAYGDGKLYLVEDDGTGSNGQTYIFDLDTMSYTGSFNTPWPSNEVFSAATWLWPETPVGGGFCNTDGPILIPGTGTAAGVAAPYPSTLTVSGLTGTITDLNIELNGLSHTYPDDLDMLLVGPNGENILFLSDAGSGTDIITGTLVFDDEAVAAIPDSGPMVSGTYLVSSYGSGDTFPAPAPAPSTATALSVFDGTDPNGTWELYIYDDAGGDVGQLDGWCLQIETDGGPTATPEPSVTATTEPTATVTTEPTVTATAEPTVSATATPPAGQCSSGGPPTVLYFNDFETDDGGWTESGFGDWEWGEVVVPGDDENCGATNYPEPPGAYSGTNAWATNLNGCYSNSGATSTISRTFDFSNVEGPIMLSWWEWYNIFGSFDTGAVLVNGTPLYTIVTSTPTADWQQVMLDLSAYAGNASVTVEFQLSATTVVNRYGWYIDDVSVTGCDTGGGATPTPTTVPATATATGTTVPATATATGTSVPVTATATQQVTAIQLNSLNSDSGSATPWLLLSLAGLLTIAGFTWVSRRRR
ncbi:MAG: hypothetical protein H6638_00515 [Ardenticatenales bacterium]|nr:hypothetical protein [Ardenticatenales bacterium]MCB9171551.1 hypothetical protein [Ardenticatenales bacterium]